MELHPGRLAWRCRRGLKELDVLILPFFEQHFSALGPEQQQIFSRFLAEEDVDLLDWLVNNLPAPPQYALLLRQIQQVDSRRC